MSGAGGNDVTGHRRMSDANSGNHHLAALLGAGVRTCLGCGLLASLALGLWVTHLNPPLRTLPDLLAVVFYLSLFYGAASVILGAGIALAASLWLRRAAGRSAAPDEVASLAAAGFFGLGVFFCLGSWWRYRIVVVEESSPLAPLALAQLALLGLVAAATGWLVYRLHRAAKGRLRRLRRWALLALPALVGLWLLGSGYALGRDVAIEEAPRDRVRAARTATKVLLLAIDAANWTALDPLLASGRLPNLGRLIASGASGPLENFEPTESPLIWTSIATGMTPEKHGIRDYVVGKIPGLSPSYLFSPFQASYPRFTGVRLAIELGRRLGWVETLPVTSDMRRAKTIWDILGEAGFTVGINGWWATWPAEPVNGYLVSEYVSVTPEAHARSLKLEPETLTYPPALFEDIAPLLKGPRDRMTQEEVEQFATLEEAELEILNGPYRSEEPLSNLKWIYHRDQNAHRTEKMLMQRFRPGFSTVYLRGIDIISHLFWQYVEPEKFEGVDPLERERFGDLLDNYTALVDSMIGELLELVDEDTAVFVVSDHGFEATGELPLSGHHPNAPDGIVIASGKNIRRARLEGVSVLDITPTLLHLMGLPVSREMDGRVVTEMLAEEFLTAHPVREIDSYGSRGRRRAEALSEESREEIEQRLRALGYLD